MHRVLWDRGPVLIHTIAIDSTTLNDSRSHKELREYFYYMTVQNPPWESFKPSATSLVEAKPRNEAQLV